MTRVSPRPVLILVLFLVMFIAQTAAVTYCGHCLLQLTQKLVLFPFVPLDSETPATRSLTLPDFAPQGVYPNGAGVYRVSTSLTMPRVLATCQEEVPRVFASELFLTSLK